MPARSCGKCYRYTVLDYFDAERHCLVPVLLLSHPAHHLRPSSPCPFRAALDNPLKQRNLRVHLLHPAFKHSAVAMTRFGDFAPLCHDTPSYPWCNLFYRQLRDHNSSALVGASADPATAPVGINPNCAIPFVGVDHSLANIANIIACGLSIFVVAALIWFTSRRRAAVGTSDIFLIRLTSVEMFVFPQHESNSACSLSSTSLPFLFNSSPLAPSYVRAQQHSLY